MVSDNFFLYPLVVSGSGILVNANWIGSICRREWKEIKLIFLCGNWNNTSCKQLLVSNVSFNELLWLETPNHCYLKEFGIKGAHSVRLALSKYMWFESGTHKEVSGWLLISFSMFLWFTSLYYYSKFPEEVCTRNSL